MLLVCSTFSICDTRSHSYCTVAESSSSVPRRPTIKTTSGIRRFGAPFSFLSFILVCVFAILTPLIPNWFKPTQNHSRVYTHWRHKRNTSIWEHQHDIFIDRYVLCSFYSKYALIVHGLAMPFYYSRCILTDPQAEKKSVWEHQPTTSIDQYVPSLFNIINDEFILIYT